VRVLAFRHVPFEGAGRIEEVLCKRGITLEYVDLYRADAREPDVRSAAGLIFLGGPMSMNDDLPYLRREMEIFEDARNRCQPVMGICLGAQLIAKATGARVYPNASKEIGWFDLHLTEAGAADPLLADASRTETVFHWHGETFDLPAGALWLAYSDHCRNQAFRIGTSVYGLQFHLEITPGMIEDWSAREENGADVRLLDSPLDAFRHTERMKALSESVFGRWCDLL
jgi:GMP synthase (glutamine-hydrolysing)